ncbi:DUF4232 domain-containing protein [Amycolatopsis sp. 195334CR]|uniref:DUF4232 domain-containing protein n=1 Tax=Amycolatopsis sp. 195334CR TaxID=2814588 RepID=UPI001A8DDA87|nr:DUF4232 domain-containing protein [Amycolatopsis sp. 195334CR]MBN6035400.1 DUF4232 domain-containing protein [Amycolatopsis sp. 195334CR]
MKNRNWATVATFVTLGLALTACGEQAPQTAAPAASTPSSSAAPTSEPTTTPPTTTESTASPGGEAPAAGNEKLCKVADLTITLGGGDAAAGTVYRQLEFINAGKRTCTIQGFPGVSYAAGSDEHQVGPAAFREGSKGEAIELAPGEKASADVGFVQVRNYDPGTCQPTEVTGIKVYPPQETAYKIVPFEGTGCAGEQIPGNQLTVKTITG